MKSLCSGRVFGQVDCYVLADGRRVISQRGAVRGLTQKPGETSGREGGNLAAYLHQDLSDDVRDAFRSHLDLVEVVAKQSRSKNDFWNRMERQFGGAMLQLDLDPEFA